VGLEEIRSGVRAEGLGASRDATRRLLDRPETGGIWKNNLVVSAVPNRFGDIGVLNNRARDYNLYYYTGGTVTDATPEPTGPTTTTRS
jgi:hypothetical protein